LFSNTIGSTNVGVGHSALMDNTSGAGNVAVGAQALDTNSSGERNVAVGSAALGASTTANDNVGVGVSALERTTAGFDDLAAGSNALQDNTTASYNLNAIYSNKTAANDLGIGINSASVPIPTLSYPCVSEDSAPVSRARLNDPMVRWFIIA
jgi:hypothetical protein